MDVAINGESSLRLVNSINHKKSPSKKLNKDFVNIWRLIVFSITSGVLVTFLIKNGWETIDKDKIKVKGNLYTTKEEIINKIAHRLPSQILNINPKEYEIILLKELPLKSAKVSRFIYPAQLHVNLLERKPVAIATRYKPEGVQEGMIDIDAYWIPFNNSNKKMFTNEELIFVDGWRKSYQKQIAMIYKYRESLNTKLEKIIITKHGEINLETSDFSLIYLGSNSRLLKNQLNTLSYLAKSLPDRFIKDSPTILDIKDPSKPKLLSK